MEPDTIDLTQNYEEDEPINLDGSALPNITEETAEGRSFKINYALGKVINKNRDEIKQGLLNGEEENLRVEAAGAVDLKKMEETRTTITDLLSKKQTLTPEEGKGITDLAVFMNAKTDPSSVFEQSYAKKLVSSLDEYAEINPTSDFAKAKRENPSEVAKIQDQFSEIAYKREFAGTLLANINDDLKQQSWPGYVADFAKSLIPGYTDWALRGNVPGVGRTAGITLAGNLDEQSKKIFSLPPGEFEKTLVDSVTYLRENNPQRAVEFLQALISQSSGEALAKNVALPLDVATSGVGGLTAKGLKAFAKKTALSDARKAVADIVEEGTKPNATRSSIAEGAGDLKEAAVIKSTTSLAAKIRGATTATEEAVDALTSAMRTDLIGFKEGAAKAGTSRELVNRVSENSERLMNDVILAQGNLNKVERIPGVLDDEVKVRALIDDTVDLYPSLKNSVLNVDIKKEPVSTNILAEMYLGKNNGTYFSSRSVAENFIKFHRINDAVIAEGVDAAKKAVRYFLPRASVKDGESIGFTERNGSVTFYRDSANEIAVSHKNAPEVGYVEVSIEDGKVVVGKSSLGEKPTGQYAINIDGEIFTGKNSKEALNKYNKFYRTKKTPEFEEGTVTSEGRFVSNEEAKSLTQGVAIVEQQGLGYYVKWTVPVPENSSVMRDLIAETGHTKMPDSPLRNFVTSILGKANLRSPEEVLSETNRQNRLAVTFGPSVLYNILKDNAKEVSKLKAGRFSSGSKKKTWDEFQRMLEYADKKIDPANNKPGYTYKSVEDLSTDWVSVLGRLPEEQEIAAYFAFKDSMEVDRMFRNIAAHNQMQRVGAMTNSLSMVDKVTGQEIKSAEFAGIAKRDFPGGDGNVLIMDEEGNQTLKKLSDMSSEDKKIYSERVKKGELRSIELHDPERRPLNGFGSVTDERIQYVVSPTVETRALDWNQIPRRGGGHLVYDYDFYIKQAKVHRDIVSKVARYWYEGDTTIVPIQFRSMGVEVAKHLDQVRLLLKAKDEAGAEAYSNANLPFDWDQVKGWFMGVKKGPEFHPPMLNLREPIQVVGRGESIINIDKKLERRYSKDKSDGRFKDGTKSNSLARQQQIEFSGERDSYNLMSIEDKGSRGNPLYTAVPAKTIDPITAMQRGLQRIIKSNFYNDYKTSSVEHWLKEAAPYLEASDAKIKYSPFYYYNEAKFKKSAPADVVTRLKTAKYQIDQIVGMPSETDNLLYQYAQKLSDYAYRTLGPNAPVLTPSWLVPKLRDPYAFARSMVFHPTMGLFNIPQFMVQMANYGNIFGIAGYKASTPGMLGAQLHFWTRANSHPNIIDFLDKKASQFHMPGAYRFKPGQWKEAFEEGNNTGFLLVGREVAQLDDPMSTKVFTNGKDKFLDWGTMFFRGGEQNARMGAWYTAYMEFRAKNPVGRITDADRAKILQRADNLNINMSRASATALNHGWKSVPMQFFSYNQRLLSLFFSGRISHAERARLLAWNAALYGVPAAAGVTGLPVVDYLRKVAIDDFNYVVGDNAIESLIMEGIPSSLVALATGGGDPSAGTYLDFGQRFQTKGLEFLSNIGTPDKSFLDIVGGAAYSFAKNTYASSDGLRRALLSMATGDGDLFPMKVEDLTDVARSISSVNSVFKVWASIESGKIVSKNDAWLADGSVGQSILTALTGLKDQRINDMQLKNSLIKQRKQYQDEAEKSFQQDFRRGMKSHQSGDHEAGEKSLTRARRWLDIGGFRPDQINSVMGKALDDTRSILDKIDMDYYIRKAPVDDTEAKLKAYQRTLEINQNKAQ